jgi:uncharacterized membrane protein
MKTRTALISILIISIMGLLFSGYLSYGEVFKKVCTASKLGMGTCTNVAEIPACVYGFFMYLIVFVISILGLRSLKNS